MLKEQISKDKAIKIHYAIRKGKLTKVFKPDGVEGVVVSLWTINLGVAVMVLYQNLGHLVLIITGLFFVRGVVDLVNFKIFFIPHQGLIFDQPSCRQWVG